MLALSKEGCTILKNVRGLFWTLDKKRKVRAGLLINGSSDLIGGTRKIVTQDMVGKQVFIWTCIEVKTVTGVASREQKDFVQFVRENGGYAGIARSPEDALEIIKPD